MKRTRNGWAIANSSGLYTGWHFTRAAAIAEHVHDMRRLDDPPVSRFAIRGRLDNEQREQWSRAKRLGDRAVRVTITYSFP